ncbi:CopD family protein [Blastococcus xanthinilyticus]|uniref:Copper transport protein n=1 Tax=Blastococcus xanthinilyticus TaxID=1564164 RepID=A0A5S5CWW9_9ACTN|nr:CopD family protein [Blastococcus xanthinilyticus]TYP87584.1 copper transport protein [Blastococcus xanthinilyticus]
MLAVLAALVAVPVLVLGTAGPARAHATLIGTAPAEGAVLTAAPDRAVFTFDEPVVEVPGGVQVFDARGRAIESSAAVGGAELLVTLPGSVGEGTLVVVWRVVSEDGHPLNGSLSFSVGAASTDIARPPAAAAGAAQAPPALSLVRWGGYAGLFLATGLVGFAALFLPPSANRARRRIATVARAGAVVTALAWLAVLPLTASYRVGAGASLFPGRTGWSSLSAAEHSVTAAVVVGVVAAVALLGRGRSGGRLALTVAVVAAGAPAWTGHTRAASPEVLAVGVDVLHLLAGSVWFGGLVGLALTLPELAGRGTGAAEVLARFSGVAAGILAVLVVTGSVLAWRFVGSWDGLTGTGYGQLLLLKIGVAALAVGIAAWNRFRLLPRVRRASREPARRSGARLVTRSVAAEAAVLVAVVLVTGFLVDRSPEGSVARAASAGTGGGGVQTVRLEDVVVRAALSPQAVGPNTLTIEVADPTGGPAGTVQSLSARVSSEELDLGTVPLAFAAAGRYTASVVLPAAGAWRVQVSLRFGEFESSLATAEFTVAAG